VSVGPLGVVPFLVALGASGERGQRVLDRLRSVVRGLLVALVLTPTAIMMPCPLSAGWGSITAWG
jgi:hypothetical protein